VSSINQQQVNRPFVVDFNQVSPFEDQLEDALMSEPVLSLPRLDKQFYQLYHSGVIKKE